MPVVAKNKGLKLKIQLFSFNFIYIFGVRVVMLMSSFWVLRSKKMYYDKTRKVAGILREALKANAEKYFQLFS